MRRLAFFRKKLVVITDSPGRPQFVLSAQYCLRDAVFDEIKAARRDVVGQTKCDHTEDDVIDTDLILSGVTAEPIF
jgi:hypothetical protein